MPDLKARLEALRPTIKEMLSTAGTVGLSYGVIHQGKLIHIDNFGLRDVENGLPMTEDTVLPICSMSKGLTSSVLALLVEDGTLAWDTKVKDILPEYQPRSEMLRESATLVDWLSMRSGTEYYQAWFQSQNHIIIPPDDAMKAINNLTQLTDLRSHFQYSNWSYELVAQVIKKLSGQTWYSLLHSKILDPLSLKRTIAHGNLSGLENVAEAYTVLDDGSPHHIPTTSVSGTTLMGAGGGVKSCVKDLLILYHAILRAATDQFSTGKTSTSDSPFKQLAHTMSAHMPLPGNSLYESSYGMGWIRTQTPNIPFKIGNNYGQLGEAPILGASAPPRLLIGHYGSMPGAQCGVQMLPDSQTVVVVQSNTTAMADMADYTIQLLIQTIFDFPNKIDYQSWTAQTVFHERNWHARLTRTLAAETELSSSPRNPKHYVGVYKNAPHTLAIHIRLKPSDPDLQALQMLLQGREDESYDLKRFQHDAFSWLQPRDELVKRGRWVLDPAMYYVLRFQKDEYGVIDRVFWQNDAGVPKGECFLRHDEPSAQQYDT